MKTNLFDPQWLSQLRATATQPPRKVRIPLYLGSQQIGSVEPDLLESLLGKISTTPDFAGLPLCLADVGSHWKVLGDGTRSLNLVAQALRHMDVAYVRALWRGEQLAVFGDADQAVASVERGAVRALGIATRAVHLLGYAPKQTMWIQQRALNKATEPGLWDTLMGGMISAADTLASALERETWEEAGLRMHQLQDLRWGGQIKMQKPNSADGGVGYMVEQTDWYEALVPEGVEPQNQDGEVAQFARVSYSELLRLLHSNAFTTEAALILTHALRA